MCSVHPVAYPRDKASERVNLFIQQTANKNKYLPLGAIFVDIQSQCKMLAGREVVFKLSHHRAQHHIASPKQYPVISLNDVPHISGHFHIRG